MEDPDNKTVAQAGERYFEADEPVQVELDSKYRCQYSNGNQCFYHTMEGQNYCKNHIATVNPNFRKAVRLKKYKLTQYYMRVEEFVSNPQLKDLSEEIGILNMTLETLLNQCHTKWDLEMKSQRIESLIEKIAKTVQINARLQSMLGKALDQTTLATLLDAISLAICEENLNTEQLKRIGVKTAAALGRSQEQAAKLALEKLGG